MSLPIAPKCHCRKSKFLSTNFHQTTTKAQIGAQGLVKVHFAQGLRLLKAEEGDWDNISSMCG